VNTLTYSKSMHPVKQIYHRVEWVPHAPRLVKKREKFLHRVVWDA